MSTPEKHGLDGGSCKEAFLAQWDVEHYSSRQITTISIAGFAHRFQVRCTYLHVPGTKEDMPLQHQSGWF